MHLAETIDALADPFYIVMFKQTVDLERLPIRCTAQASAAL
jgi:hypothetical protein